HQSRDRCGLCQLGAKAGRGTSDRPRRVFHQPPRPTGHAGGASRSACDLFLPRVCRSRRVDELRNEQCGPGPPGWCLCRPHPQGRETGGPSDPAAHQVRVRHQPAGCQDDRPHCATDPSRPRRRGDRVKRREFITLLGGATAWPLAAHAQQPAMPVIGFLGVTFAHEQPQWLAAFRQGLHETGFIEGENVLIEYRWAEGQYNRLPELASDLIRRHVSVIVTPPSAPAALAAKAATMSIPIVFSVGEDPVGLGLVASLSRPGGNATGINFLIVELTAKRLGLLRELLPKLARIGVLVNPGNVGNTDRTVKDVKAAATAIGLQIQVLNASNSDEIDAAFSTLVSDRADALLLGPDAFFNSRRVQIAILAARHMVPAVYTVRDYPEAGGLISYGTNVTDAIRQQGVYAGRILKGIKPADLPVVQSTKFELVINLKTAKGFGLEIPPTLLARTDEVIE